MYYITDNMIWVKGYQDGQVILFKVRYFSLLGTSGDVRPVQTGLDTIQIMTSLQKNYQPFSFKLPSGKLSFNYLLNRLLPWHSKAVITGYNGKETT